MKYLCLVYREADFHPTPAEAAEFLSFRKQMTEVGVFVDSGLLQPVGSTTTVRVRDGQAVLTDGPFAEMKEHVGGYVLLECADLDELLKWITVLPGARDGSVEIRPLVEMGG